MKNSIVLLLCLLCLNAFGYGSAKKHLTPLAFSTAVRDSVCDMPLTVKVVRSGGTLAVDGARVTLRDEQEQVVDAQTTDRDGSAAFRVACGKRYSIVVERPGFDTAISWAAIPAQSGAPLVFEVPLEVTQEKLGATPIYYAMDKVMIHNTQQIPLPIRVGPASAMVFHTVKAGENWVSPKFPPGENLFVQTQKGKVKTNFAVLPGVQYRISLEGNVYCVVPNKKQ